MEDAMMFHKCFKEDSRKFPGCFKYFYVACTHRNYPSRRRACFLSEDSNFSVPDVHPSVLVTTLESYFCEIVEN